MAKHTRYVPGSLEQVWQWKNAIYREVAHLPTDEALAEILNRAAVAARRHGFTTSPGRSRGMCSLPVNAEAVPGRGKPTPQAALSVAEAGEPYRAKRRKQGPCREHTET